MGLWRFLYSAPLARPSSLARVVVTCWGLGHHRDTAVRSALLCAIVPVILLVVSCHYGLISVLQLFGLVVLGPTKSRSALFGTWNAAELVKEGHGKRPNVRNVSWWCDASYCWGRVTMLWQGRDKLCSCAVFDSSYHPTWPFVPSFVDFCSRFTGAN
jgi:hypothetical protein